MIERQIILDDGRILKYHEFAEPNVDIVNKRIYVLTRSYERLGDADYSILRAIIDFDTYEPELLNGLASVIQTAELKLYVGIEDNAIISLESLKAKKRSIINSERDRLEKEGFPYMDKMIDSDMQSVSRINTTFSAAMACFILGQPFSIEWTCADNTKLELDAQGMIGMPQALAIYGSALHNRATYLKGQVEAITSTDIEEVKALLAEIPDF